MSCLLQLCLSNPIVLLEQKHYIVGANIAVMTLILNRVMASLS